MIIHDQSAAAPTGLAKRATKSKQSSQQPDFTQGELRAMHRYCMRYGILVLSDGQPTPEQNERFMLFQRICYAEGIARAK